MNALADLPQQQRHHAPARTLRAVLRAALAGVAALNSPPPMRLADWAREHFRLSAGSSQQKGAWEPWPFQVGIMDSLSSDDIEQVSVQKAKRVGWTKILTAFIGYNAAHRNRNQALWQPTDDDRDSFVKSEVDPMVADVAAVRTAVRGAAENTIKYKRFRASVAHFLGGKAARAYRRITVAAALLDEIDGFDQQVEKSADPVTLARGRLEGAPFPKLAVGSTPRLQGLSHIEREIGYADVVLRYRIDCPHCGVDHPLIWGDGKIAHGIKWDGDDPATVRHLCPHCRGAIVQADYLRQAAAGAWVCDRTGIRYGADRTWRGQDGQPLPRAPRHVAFSEVWTAYSPQRDWPDIVREYLNAMRAHRAGDDGPLQGFTNETLARTYRVEYEHTESDTLQRRAKAEGLPLGVVPAAACMLTRGVDVQADRWELVTWAHGRHDETWAIDYQVIHGNTADLAEWQRKIAPLVGASYPHARGGRLAVSAMGIDTGYQTHVAYQFVRAHQARGVYATKGDSQPGKPIKSRRKLLDINTAGRIIRRGVAVWFIGTDTAKDLLHGRLQLDGAGPGRVHFAAGLPAAFFDQLTAEQRIPVRTVRGLEHRWECPSGKRNEVLDCTVIGMFLAEVLDLPRWTDRQWQRAEAALHPDLFDTPVPPAAPPVKADEPTATAVPALARRAPPPAHHAIASDEWSSRL